MATYSWIQLKGGRRACDVKIRVKNPEGRVITRKKRFKRKTDAKAWAAKIEAEIRAGAGGGGSQRILVDDVIALYRRHKLPLLKRERDQVLRSRMLDWWSQRLGTCDARRLQPRTVLEHLDALVEGGRTVATRNRYKAALGACFKIACKRGLLTRADDPTAGLTEPEPHGRERWLDEDERQRLLEAVAGEDPLELIVRLALSTGARQGEILQLRWKQIDFEQNAVYLGAADTKTGRSRALPLVASCRQMLIERRRVRRLDDDRVFSTGLDRIWFPKKAWAAALERAGIEDLRFHDLRHSAASALAKAGFNTRQLAEILGHQTLRMVMRYSHFAQGALLEEARDAMESQGIV